MATQRINDKDEHVNELNRRLRELKAAYVGLGTSDDFEELFHIIHGPGWTTLPEIFPDEYSCRRRGEQRTERTNASERHFWKAPGPSARRLASRRGAASTRPVGRGMLTHA